MVIDTEAVARLIYWLGHTGSVQYPGSARTYSYILGQEIDHVGDSVLDVGCSTGIGLAKFAQVGFHTMGIDVDFCALQIARGFYPWLDWVMFDVSRAPLNQASDIVISCESFEHMEDQDMAFQHLLAAAGRVLYLAAPNGAVGPGNNPLHTHEPLVEEMIARVAGAEDFNLTAMLSTTTLRPILPGTDAADILYVIERKSK